MSRYSHLGKCAGRVRNLRLGSSVPGAEEVNYSFSSAGEDPESLQVPPHPLGAGYPPDVWGVFVVLAGNAGQTAAERQAALTNGVRDPWTRYTFISLLVLVHLCGCLGH